MSEEKRTSQFEAVKKLAGCIKLKTVAFLEDVKRGFRPDEGFCGIKAGLSCFANLWKAGTAGKVAGISGGALALLVIGSLASGGSPESGKEVAADSGSAPVSAGKTVIQSFSKAREAIKDDPKDDAVLEEARRHVPVASDRLVKVARALAAFKYEGKSVEQLANEGELPNSLFDKDYPPAAYLMLPAPIPLANDGTVHYDRKGSENGVQLVLSTKALGYTLLFSNVQNPNNTGSRSPKVTQLDLRSEAQLKDKLAEIRSRAQLEVDKKELYAIATVIGNEYGRLGHYPDEPLALLEKAGISGDLLKDAGGTPYVVLSLPARSDIEMEIETDESRIKRQGTLSLGGGGGETELRKPFQVYAYSRPSKDGFFCSASQCHPSLPRGNNAKFGDFEYYYRSYATLETFNGDFKAWEKKIEASVQPLHKERQAKIRKAAQENMERIALNIIEYKRKTGRSGRTIEEIIAQIPGKSSLPEWKYIPGRNDLEYILLDRPVGEEFIVALEPAGVREDGLWVADKFGNAHFKEIAGETAQEAYLNNLLSGYVAEKSSRNMKYIAEKYRGESRRGVPLESELEKALRKGLLEHFCYLPFSAVELPSSQRQGTTTPLILCQPAGSYAAGLLACGADGTVAWLCSADLSVIIDAEEQFRPSERMSGKEQEQLMNKLVEDSGKQLKDELARRSAICMEEFIKNYQRRAKRSKGHPPVEELRMRERNWEIPEMDANYCYFTQTTVEIPSTKTEGEQASVIICEPAGIRAGGLLAGCSDGTIAWICKSDLSETHAFDETAPRPSKTMPPEEQKQLFNGWKPYLFIPPGK